VPIEELMEGEKNRGLNLAEGKEIEGGGKQGSRGDITYAPGRVRP